MVILFDGVCNLCNGFVQFVLKRDREKIFQFASLQSTYGTEFLEFFHLKKEGLKTIILYDGQKVRTQSDAVIKIATSLGGIWKTAVVLFAVPRFIRNLVYRLIAQNRYKLFGKKEQCMVPSADMKDRFLNDKSFKK